MPQLVLQLNRLNHRDYASINSKAALIRERGLILANNKIYIGITRDAMILEMTVMIAIKKLLFNKTIPEFKKEEI